KDLLEELEAFSVHRLCVEEDAGDMTARTAQALRQPAPNGIALEIQRDDRDRPVHRADAADSGRAHREDHRDLGVEQLPGDLTEVIFEGGGGLAAHQDEILAEEPSAFLQAFGELAARVQGVMDARAAAG